MDTNEKIRRSKIWATVQNNKCMYVTGTAQDYYFARGPIRDFCSTCKHRLFGEVGKCVGELNYEKK